MFCTNCGASCAEGLTFCARCGSPLPAPSTGAAAPFPAEPPVPDTTPDPSPPTPNLAPGVLLLDRYSIIRELGEGGMGKVFLAFDNVLGVPVAVKVLAAHLARDPQAVERLKEEARLAMRLAHPHIVRVNHFEDGRTLKFLVMEYVDGETLARRLAREKRLPEAEVRRIGVVLSDALVHAHAHKVLHRDLKPSNVLLGVDGLLKLADFGIARVAHDSTSRLTGHVTSGTLPYMSPEQLRGQHGDARSDLYSLGVTLYELLAGRLPFGPGGYIPHQILHEPPPPLEDVSPQLAATVLRLLSKDPADRHATAGDLRDELDGTAGRGQAGFGGVATSRAVRPPVKPRAVAGTLAFIGLLFFLTWLGLRLSPWTATDHPAADTPEQHDAVLADKIRGYVFDCMQTTTRDVLGFKTDYVSTFDEKRGPTG